MSDIRRFGRLDVVEQVVLGC